MKKVHFLAVKQDGIIDYLLTPVRHNRKAFKDREYQVDIFYKPTGICLSCDILCLLSKAVMLMFNDRNTYLDPDGPLIHFIEKARQNANKIIWFDTSDSTTVTHFELLPYVDLYLKKQIFKDKSLYRQKFYGGRIFSDYYHRQFGVVDPVPFDQYFPLDPALEDKIDLSWNIGLGDMANSGTRKSFYRRYFADTFPARYNPPFTSVTDKTFDLFLSTSANLKRPSVAFHRQTLIERLRAIQQKHNLSGAVNGPRLPEKKFRQTLKSTKMMPSPFGWGELGLRDYEAFMYGAALLKPEMSHMATWPGIFISEETYQPFQWDFQDLEKAVLTLLTNPIQRTKLAQQGQDAYRDTISPNGMARFCDWFVQQVEKKPASCPEK